MRGHHHGASGPAVAQPGVPVRGAGLTLWVLQEGDVKELRCVCVCARGWMADECMCVYAGTYTWVCVWLFVSQDARTRGVRFRNKLECSLPLSSRRAHSHSRTRTRTYAQHNTNTHVHTKHPHTRTQRTHVDRNMGSEALCGGLPGSAGQELEKVCVCVCVCVMCLRAHSL